MTEGMTIRVNGIALRCLVEGAADPLVLIQGVGASLEVWDGVAARLRDRYRVVRYDQRGHGQSDKASGPYTVEVFSNDLRALLDAFAIERAHVAGHSLGGLVAQSFALDYPARLRKLALISTVAGRTEEERRRVEERLAMVATGIAGDHFRASLDRWFTDEFRAANPKLLEAYAARNQANDPACYAAAYRVLAETDLAARLHEITAETLVMTGEHDQGSNPRMARLMHERIAGSTLRILPVLRHSILVEAPDMVASVLGDFLDGGLQLSSSAPA
jgi:(E)-2-((N-methylformamido)methylene)succinate hydrolase